MMLKKSIKFISLTLALVMILAAVPASALSVTALDAKADTTDLVFSAKEIYDLTEKGIWGDKYGCQGYDEVTYFDKNGAPFVRLSSEGGAGTAEAYFHLFYTKHDVAPIMAIKYRTPTSGFAFEVLSDSKNAKPVGTSSSGFTSISGDGKWHLVTIDLASKIADYNGESANYFRFDFMNASTLPKNASLDIEYIAFFDTVEDAQAYDKQYGMSDKGTYIDPSSSYTVSKLAYWSVLDMINGAGPNGAAQYSARGGNSKKGIDRILYGGNTFENNYLVLSGWSVVDGGVSKYVWSADGGKTWNDTVLYNRKSIFDNSSGNYITAVENNGLTLTDPEGAKKLASYQCASGLGVNCNGIAADLSEYEGKIVDVTFAAVPLNDPDTLCLMHYVEDVYVGVSTDKESFERNNYYGSNTEVVTNANALANGVDAYYGGYDRNEYTIKNQNTLVNFDLTTGGQSTVSSITDLAGSAYITDTMKIYARTTGGKTYYASNYVSAARPNIYRLGYYYYDAHILDTDFVSSATVTSSKALKISSFTKYSSQHSTKPSISNEVLSITIKNPLDAYVASTSLSYTAESYNAIQITIKSESASSMDILFSPDGANFSSKYSSNRNNIKNDGQWHTYTFSTELWDEMGYTGEITGLRFDFDGQVGSEVQIKDVKVVNISYDKIPLTLDRTMHTYSDKLHQEIHVVAYEDTDNIEAMGVITEIDANTVEKLIVKDKNGTHTSLSGVDWESAEYIGFDIKNVGVFGYILPFDGKSGGITVSLANGVYTVTQEACPNNSTILAPIYDTTNDFKMGQRIYTDKNHSFDEFIKEAEIERNPLTAENIVIDTDSSPRSKFKGYDPIRGAYYFTLQGAANFNVAYYNSPNKHYELSFGVTGDGTDRTMYVLAHTSSGALECAALLDINDMMLPVPLEVCKNFSEGEEPIYNCGDTTYGDTIFPIAVDGESGNYFTLLDIYQNWGNYPLKQLSSIGYYVPYYHLSTGVTETNCISHYSTRSRDLEILPDFRSMSQPFWKDQPQHYNAGHHTFLSYEDSAGNIIGTEYTDVTIGSYGPTYADVTTKYITDDGKIEVSLNHMEMPQTDENRGYYQIVYTVKEDVTISNFREDFSLYSVFGYGYYTKLGYLDNTSNCKIANMEIPTGQTQEAKYYTLGTYGTYFDLFYMEDATSYGNLAFLIDSSEIIIGGQKSSAKFALKEHYQTVRLTLDIDGAVTLKAGDSFKINAIIMPWGGGWKDTNVVEFDPADYSVDVVEQSDGSKVYHVNNDESVRRVRRELLANKSANVGSVSETVDCAVISTPFLPTVQTNNGSTAQFTLRGGFDASAGDVNVTVLTKGFDNLGVPLVEELVNGSWVTYELSSMNNPDAAGITHTYDGYAVTYENGKYNYSFVTTITDNVARTFRITVKEAASAGLIYEPTADGKGYVVVGYDGENKGDIVISDRFNGLPVTAIAEKAFVCIDNVNSITISASVTEFASNSFMGELSGITFKVDESNPKYRAEGNKIIEKASGKMVFGGSAYGDADGDGEISLSDLTLLRKYCADFDIYTKSSDIAVFSGADANGDGDVNMADVLLLRRYFANYDYDSNTSSVILGASAS